MAQNVTTFTESDFSRTFQPTTGDGSDHAWGSHHLVFGGAVQGGQIYGHFRRLSWVDPTTPMSAAAGSRQPRSINTARRYAPGSASPIACCQRFPELRELWLAKAGVSGVVKRVEAASGLG